MMLSVLFPPARKIREVAQGHAACLSFRILNKGLIYMLTWHLGMAFITFLCVYFLWMDTHTHTTHTEKSEMYFTFHNNLKKIVLPEATSTLGIENNTETTSYTASEVLWD